MSLSFIFQYAAVNMIDTVYRSLFVIITPNQGHLWGHNVACVFHALGCDLSHPPRRSFPLFGNNRKRASAMRNRDSRPRNRPANGGGGASTPRLPLLPSPLQADTDSHPSTCQFIQWDLRLKAIGICFILKYRQWLCSGLVTRFNH